MTSLFKLSPKAISFDSNGVLQISDSTAEAVLKEASLLLHSGKTVAFPTETVYGLGASALSSAAVEQIYKAKNRPSDNPLITHVSSVEMIENVLHAKVPLVYLPLIQKFWPGPLTIILPREFDCPLSPLVTANQDTFAVRLPANPIARALIAYSNLPLAAPSANASTRPSPTLADHVYYDLNEKISMIIDGGACSVGLESTVVDGTVDPPMLLRPGGISLEQIENIGGFWSNIQLGKKTAGKYEKVRTPGMKYKHYSPTAKVILFLNSGDGKIAIKNFLHNELLIDKKVALLTTKLWNEDTTADCVYTTSLGRKGDEISRNLFSALRDADLKGIDVLLVEAVGEEKEGLAIMNRLEKAASRIVDCKGNRLVDLKF
ncbi:threonylcarbamoyladenylate synthase [Martiniozyma asiatica (nom. inval.)]|nr:threonylcarbamoyladenylate synthase [Martiniozyma asiatica]